MTVVDASGQEATAADIVERLERALEDAIPPHADDVAAAIAEILRLRRQEAGSRLVIIGRLGTIREDLQMRGLFEQAETIREAIDTMKRLDQSICDFTRRIYG